MSTTDGFPLVLGLDTFGDLIHDDDGRPLSHAETIRSVAVVSSSRLRTRPARHSHAAAAIFSS